MNRRQRPPGCRRRPSRGSWVDRSVVGLLGVRRTYTRTSSWSGTGTLRNPAASGVVSITPQYGSSTAKLLAPPDPALRGPEQVYAVVRVAA